MSHSIPVIRTLAPKQKPADESRLAFGQIFTDHMFMMDYVKGQGWINPRIVPYAPLQMDPSTMVFHYGQSVFEGLKAYRCADGSINLFRPHLNFERMNLSDERMAIPPLDEEQCVDAVKQLVRLEADWVPSAPETSLYIRPFVFAADPFLGVRPSNTYHFLIILSPSGPYYPQGLNPIDVYVEDEYVRAVKGGTGFTKCSGNYAASLLSQANAYKSGFVQVLWLDGIHRKYIEEVGAMNVCFVIDGKLVTPMLNGSILPGITRKSVLETAVSFGLEVEERLLSIDELGALYAEGRVSEMFGCGTAAVISPVGSLKYQDTVMTFNNGQIGPVSQRMYDTLTGIQYGRLPGPQGWIEKV